ncbi:hypothetical protein YC2023_025438 [Brassica napus]
MADRRAKGLCFNCDELYVYGHVCSPVLFYIMPVAEGDNQEDAWIEEDELEISLNAMNGEQTEQTFQVQANFATGTRWVLLDTGSTHNFIKSSLVEDLGIPIHRKSRWFVALPDGGKCPIQGFCQGIVMSVQGLQFKADCFAIPLKGFYVVLGIRWLNALGRVIWDGLNKTIEFHHSSKPVVWHGESKARGKPQVSLHALECDGEALDNWFSDEEEVFTTPGFAISRIAHAPKQSIWALAQVPTSDLLDNIINKFSMVFSKPVGLPPQRECDHRIRLLQGSNPVAVCLYRYPHLLKDEIERQYHYSLKYLLEQRLSTSPQVHWISKLLGFDFSVEYRSGMTNKVAGALSRCHENDSDEDKELHAINVSEDGILARVRREIQNDNKLGELRDKIIRGEESEIWEAKDGLIFRKGVVYMDSNSDLVRDVMTGFHNSGHEGSQKTMERIRRNFYWRGWKKSVQEFVSTCQICQKDKWETLQPAGLMQPLSDTPFRMVYGREPPRLLDYTTGSSKVEAVDVALEERDEFLASARERLLNAQNRMKASYDKHHRSVEFGIGEWVLLKLHPYRQITIPKKAFTKLSPKFYGPFEVLARVGTVSYRLRLPDRAQIHDVFHISLLKPHKGDKPDTSHVLPPVLQGRVLPAKPVKFLRARTHGEVRQVLVKWTDEETETATWEDAQKLTEAFPEIELEDKLLVQERKSSIVYVVGLRWRPYQEWLRFMCLITLKSSGDEPDILTTEVSQFVRPIWLMHEAELCAIHIGSIQRRMYMDQ